MGSEFMPPLWEGDLQYMPTTFPGISVTKARELLQQTDKILRTFPEVESVLGKVGRAETATDPAAEDADGLKALLPDVVEAAGKLAGAGDIAAAREAFFLLSKRLARYREMVGGERPAVAYCPMVKKSWLQPLGEIGNPYHGQSMPRCGEIVSE